MKKRVFAIVLTIILCTSVFSLSAFATDSSGNPDGIHGLVDVRLSLGRREPGDSGGPIYTADGLFCGTHTGAADEDNYGFSHIVFSPYVYVRNLGFSALTS